MLSPIRDTTLIPSPGPLGLPGFPSAADPLAGGIDYQRVWHAFRRRWVPALVLALTLGSIAGVLTFVFLPRGFEAVAWLRVRDRSGMFGAGMGRYNAEYEAFRKTQVQLIKSPLVLMAALRRPGIDQLSMLKGDEDTYHRVCTIANLLSSHDNPYVNSSALMNSLCEEDSDLKLAFEAILPIYAGDDLWAGRLHKQIMRDARDEKQFMMANGEVRTMRQLLQRQQG